MPMMSLICPECGAETKLSLVLDEYEGPRRCWKCHEFFTIKIKNNELVSCEPMTEEEFQRQQEIEELRNKFRK
ncbi:MAG: hypothetical protein MUO19_07780 [Dehalococcoidales bacterium]|nr:hypothetical protein [Dehalococcoidales bacterium]